MRGDGQHARGAEVQGWGERRGETDTAVAVPMLSDANRWKDERQRGRGHDVIDGQRLQHAAAQRARPRIDVAAGGPRDRLAGGVVERCHGYRTRMTAGDVLGDAGDLAFVVRREEPLQQLP